MEQFSSGIPTKALKIPFILYNSFNGRNLSDSIYKQCGYAINRQAAYSYNFISRTLFINNFFVILQMICFVPAPLPLEGGQQAGHILKLAAYSISLRYLYTVGLLSPQTLASSLTFILFAANAG